MDERMLTFIHSFDSEKPAYLDALERYARETNVPIIRPQMQSLLRLLVTWGRPIKILEVGTAIGFSALLMSEYAPAGCHITTIEKYEKRIPIAKENFEKAGKADCITLLEGDAAEILASIKDDGAFDLIFMDAAKGQYINFFARYPAIIIADRSASVGQYSTRWGADRIQICGDSQKSHDS